MSANVKHETSSSFKEEKNRIQNGFWDNDFKRFINEGKSIDEITGILTKNILSILIGDRKITREDTKSQSLERRVEKEFNTLKSIIEYRLKKIS